MQRATYESYLLQTGRVCLPTIYSILFDLALFLACAVPAFIVLRTGKVSHTVNRIFIVFDHRHKRFFKKQVCRKHEAHIRQKLRNN